MIPVSVLNLGNTLTVFTTFAGTFTTFPIIFICFPRGALYNFSNTSLGETNLDSNSLKSSSSGFRGNDILLALEHLGILPFFKFLMHVLQTQLKLVSSLEILLIHFFTATFVNPDNFAAFSTPCLYHN